jgi:transposase
LTTREQFTKQLTADKNSLRALSRKAVQTPVANRLFEKNIRRLSKDIEAIDKAIQQLIDQDPSLKQKAGLVEGVPGVGLLLTANLMVITSGFTQNVTPKSLAAYLGICPYEHESGSSVRRRPRSDRYGNGKARKLLHLAARSTATHRHNFRAYYLRKLAEGKPKRLALNNVANRLLRIICAVVRDGAPYCETHRSVHPALVA